MAFLVMLFPVVIFIGYGAGVHNFFAAVIAASGGGMHLALLLQIDNGFEQIAVGCIQGGFGFLVADK